MKRIAGILAILYILGGCAGLPQTSDNTSEVKSEQVSISFVDVYKNPTLYQDSQITWKGVATNVITNELITTFDFLIGYDTYRIIDGIVPVFFNRYVSFNINKPIELIGIILVANDGTISIEGIEIIQE
jgi:hypothetical protein